MQLTVREAAKILGTPEKQIYRLVDDGEIPFYRVNDQLRFNRTELLEWATARRMPVSVALFQYEEDSGKSLPNLADALELGGIHFHVTGADREAVLRAIVGTMRLPEELDRELLIQLLLARESMGSTGIGDGIAIPHVRSPVVLNGAPASVTLCFLDKPVEFEAVDRQPVHTIFSIVSATIRGHLQLLSKLAWALNDAAFKTVVLRRGTAEEILKEARRVETTFPPGQPE